MNTDYTKCEAAHTPWHVSEPADQAVRCRIGDYEYTCPPGSAQVRAAAVPSGCLIPYGVVHHADAELIARAPDMAAELTTLRTEVERLRAELTIMRRKVEALRTASAGSRGWLVEWRYHGSVQWLYLWSAAGGGFSFTADASKALRLARREDAEAVLGWARVMDSKRGLRSSTFLVTEHVWESAALASTEGVK